MFGLILGVALILGAFAIVSVVRVPELKKQIFLELLIGGNQLRIRRISTSVSNKIQAIKAVRAVTGFGLKEAKDTVDMADLHTTKIDGDWTSEDYNKLSRELVGTGYELV